MSARERTGPVFIRSEQVEAFRRLSHDCNPLHADPAYSRSTQFGRTVVYGMCAVLLGLARWAEGRAFRLIAIRGQFGKPLFENEEYDLEILEIPAKVKVQYRKGSEIQSSFSFSFTWQKHGFDRERSDPAQPIFVPLLEARAPALPAAPERWKNQKLGYSMASEAAAESWVRLGLKAGQIPLNQLNALLGSSYFVGMELPGRQALYTGFEFEFEPAGSRQTTEPFEFHILAVDRDERV